MTLKKSRFFSASFVAFTASYLIDAVAYAIYCFRNEIYFVATFDQIYEFHATPFGFVILLSMIVSTLALLISIVLLDK